MKAYERELNGTEETGGIKWFKMKVSVGMKCEGGEDKGRDGEGRGG